MVELFEEMERIKIRFVAAYARLVERGLISEAEYEDIVQIVDNLDHYSEEELRKRLGRFYELTGEEAQASDKEVRIRDKGIQSSDEAVQVPDEGQRLDEKV